MPDILFWDRIYPAGFDAVGFGQSVLHPRKEIFHYELRCATRRTPFLRVLHTNSRVHSLPPSMMPPYPVEDAQFYALADFLEKANAYRHDVLIRGTADYPKSLLFYDIPLLYYRGDISLLSSPCVAITGSRKPCATGRQLAVDIILAMLELGKTLLSGLSAGIEAVVHHGAIASKGNTIGIMGTPINSVPEVKNRVLLETIAKKHLLLSHVPLYRSSQHDRKENRLYFPDRYKIMASLCQIAIIVDAPVASGTPALAKDVTRMGKPLILMREMLDRKDLAWPRNYARKPNVHVTNNAENVQTLVQQLCHIG